MAKVSTKNIALAIKDMTKGKSGSELDRVLVDIVNFLVNKRLMSKSGEILKKLEEMLDKDDGVVRAKITYKEKPEKKLTNQLEELLKKRYKAKDMIIEEKEDRGILGGVKVEVGDEIIDLTFKNKIKQLQNYLITN
jgi:F-type H+-transporting ATPase subunit delta